MRRFLSVFGVMVLYTFLATCADQINSDPESSQQESLTGMWVGSIDFGDSIALNLVELTSDSIMGEIIIGSNTSISSYRIVTGRRIKSDSLTIQAESQIGYLHLMGAIMDSTISGRYFHLIFSPPDEGEWWVKRFID